MKRFKTKSLLLNVPALLLLGCSSYKEKDQLKYVVGQDSFTLSHKCVATAKLQDNKKTNQTGVIIKLSDNDQCKKELNNLINSNEGKDVSVYFNETPVTSPVRIHSKIDVGNGYYQSVTNKELAIDILSAYDQ
ncbi:hypothetical protein G4234_02895 [Serratia marcescens]|uniref:hypothetical protein n=1 Tax=Serratia marcescens TaxID=615 RepID=UPI001419A706|nr:hypothetical protein [Serratia marcescens]NIA32662.1 hypothetical protein [Serratia marcescens]